MNRNNIPNNPYAAGVCFDRNDKVNNNGIYAKYILLFLITPKIKK